jgi:integrase
MPVRKGTDGVWRYRKKVKLPDGSKVRVSGTPSINTKLAAEDAERAHIERTLKPVVATQKVEVPKFSDFADQFLEVAKTHNKPSEIYSKESILRVHLKPWFGKKTLDQIGYGDIQDYVAFKAKATPKKKALSKKSINNHLTVLRRLLAVAKKRGLIAAIPEIEWLRAPKPEFDFLTFEEAERLVTGADGEWACMIVVGLRTGLRQGELLALRWEDVDLVAGQLRVRRSVTRNIVTEPKSGKGREIALGDDVLAAIKAQRHLRGELVFCHADGRMLHRNECRHPLRRACRRAGLRQIGWHTLRHTFASHLVMRAAPLRAVQELMGHATVEMTMRYAHLSPDVPRAAVRLLDSKSRGKSVAKESEVAA